MEELLAEVSPAFILENYNKSTSMRREEKKP